MSARPWNISTSFEERERVISEDGEYPPPEDKGGNRFTPWRYKTRKISDPLSSSCLPSV